MKSQKTRPRFHYGWIYEKYLKLVLEQQKLPVTDVYHLLILKISQNSQENICLTTVSFLIKLQTGSH